MSEFGRIDPVAFRQGVEDILTLAPLRTAISQLFKPAGASRKQEAGSRKRHLTARRPRQRKTMDKDAKTPDPTGNAGKPDPSRANNILAINNLHYHGNDISELRKLAQISPALAEKLIDQRDRENARIAGSYKFGLLMSAALVGIISAAFTFIVVFGGLIDAIVVVAAVLATAVLIRVVLTDEWSETSWLGRLIEISLRFLGGRPAPRD